MLANYTDRLSVSIFRIRWKLSKEAMETNSSKRCHEKGSGMTGKRKYFINQARAGKSKETAIKVENEREEESVSADEEPEPLSVDEYQTLLQLLKINLPEEALNPEVCERSTHRDVIKDSKAVVRELRNTKLTVTETPRLSCVDVKQAYGLKEGGKITDIVQMLFFKKCKKASEKTLKEWWEMKAPETGCMFRMRDTYQETPSSTPEKLVSSTGGGKAWFGKPEDNKKNETDCFSFFLNLNGLDPEDVTYKHEYKVESGFISGRLDFLLDITNSAESSEMSLREKIIIECKGTKGSMVGDVFTLPHDEGHEAELNTSHEYYYQTQAYLHILKKILNPVPVRAVMVVKVTAEDTNPKFYWGRVSDDTEHIKELDDFCQQEALPRFLAVLNLIFQKVKEQGRARAMEREEKMERGGAGAKEREEMIERGGARVMERDEKMCNPLEI